MIPIPHVLCIVLIDLFYRIYSLGSLCCDSQKLLQNLRDTYIIYSCSQLLALKLQLLPHHRTFFYQIYQKSGQLSNHIFLASGSQSIPEVESPASPRSPNEPLGHKSIQKALLKSIGFGRCYHISKNAENRKEVVITLCDFTPHFIHLSLKLVSEPGNVLALFLE